MKKPRRKDREPKLHHDVLIAALIVVLVLSIVVTQFFLGE
jgi:hypothetical protein